jgi:DNA polymerase-3 subunit delta'
MAWADILGQDQAVALLRSHLERGQIANAYLLAGPDGVGKRRIALEAAKALNCAADRERPCDACSSCQRMGRGAHPDLHVLLPGGASDQIKIEDVRQLLGRVALRPFSAAVQAAVIVGAERLTEEAANSLLKVLEEPPAHSRFFLTTARLSDCLPTIISRCQLIRFRPLPEAVIARLLAGTQACPPAAVSAIARRSGGSAAAALKLSERWEAHARTLARLADARASAWLEPPVPESRQEVAELLEDMMAWLRDVAVAAASGDTRAVAHAAQEPAVRAQAVRVDLDRCVATALELVSLRESLDQFVSPRLVGTLAREQWLSLIEATMGVP